MAYKYTAIFAYVNKFLEKRYVALADVEIINSLAIISFGAISWFPILSAIQTGYP